MFVLSSLSSISSLSSEAGSRKSSTPLGNTTNEVPKAETFIIFEAAWVSFKVFQHSHYSGEFHFKAKSTKDTPSLRVMLNLVIFSSVIVKLPDFILLRKKGIIEYSTREEYKNPDEIVHPIVREVLSYFNIPNYIELKTFGFASGGSGLGGSASFLLSLISALSKAFNFELAKDEIIDKACFLEIHKMGKPIGKNDGSIQGERYFNCAVNCGIFVRQSQLEEVVEDDHDDGNSADAIRTGNESQSRDYELLIQQKAHVGEMLQMLEEEMLLIAECEQNLENGQGEGDTSNGEPGSFASNQEQLKICMERQAASLQAILGSLPMPPPPPYPPRSGNAKARRQSSQAVAPLRLPRCDSTG
mgnify:CR=1 FL=1